MNAAPYAFAPKIPLGVMDSHFVGEVLETTITRIDSNGVEEIEVTGEHQVLDVNMSVPVEGDVQ